MNGWSIGASQSLCITYVPDERCHSDYIVAIPAEIREKSQGHNVDRFLVKTQPCFSRGVVRQAQIAFPDAVLELVDSLEGLIRKYPI